MKLRLCTEVAAKQRRTRFDPFVHPLCKWNRERERVSKWGDKEPGCYCCCCRESAGGNAAAVAAG